MNCIGPALGNLRQMRPGQAGNAKATRSPQSTPAAASNGISESPTHCPTRFVTAMVSDGRGGVWVSGEDFGIYHGVVAGSNRPDALGVKAAAAAAALAKKQPGLPRFHWHHFDASNSPGLASNSITALCVDGQGRLWAGTARHGVSVFNGKKWKHYNIVTGPLGSHVYALAYNAIANQVWIATENGISIYQCGGKLPSHNSRLPSAQRYAPHTWHYITAMDGLPPNPDCIAFDSHGRAFVGTQCNGLAIGTPAMALPVGTLPGQPFAKRKLTWHWRVIIGPEHISQLRTAYGYGLPGNLINCILVTPANHVYVGTDWGLAYSINDGESFRYERGQDYAAKIMGLWHPPRGYRPPPQVALNRLLPGDHITSLAQDLTGNIWIGTWRNGYEVLNPETGKEFKSEDSPALAKADGYISQICPITEISTPKLNQSGLQSANRRGERKIPVRLNQTMLIGRYGFGVSEFGTAIHMEARANSRIAARSILRHAASLPQAALAPTRAQLAALCGELESDPLPSATSIASVIPIGADWRTQGRWLGRYGRYWMCLFAADAPDISDMVWEPGLARISHLEFIGPHCRRSDQIRFYHTWLFTHKRRVLQLPPLYDQIDYAAGIGGSGKNDSRESEIDDHGEAYMSTWNGPDVNVTLHIPKGKYILSLYEFNKDGHTGANRDRDYTISMKIFSPRITVQQVLAGHALGFYDRKMLTTAQRAEIISRGAAMFYRRPTSVLGRIVNFWGGVWNRFIVRGPTVLLIRLGRNYSYDTILCGAALDPLNENPAPYYYGMKAWRTRLKHLSKAREILRQNWFGLKSTIPKAREIVPSDYFAKRLLRDEEFILHENPQAWARSDQLVYTSLLRWLADRDDQRFMRARHSQLAMAARIAYRLSLFSLWEGLEERLGITASRQIEKSLRWNKVYSSYRGLEFGQIREYVRRLAAERVAAKAN